jgi:Domain of unknown function (DUF4249)
MKIFNLKTIFSALYACLLSAGCDSFTRNIDIDLPEVQRDLVIECYLRPNEPYRLLLTQTSGYFDSLSQCPMTKGAMVVISHNGQKDTLEEAIYLGGCSLTNPNFIPFFDGSRTRFFNYGSNTICPLDYNNDFVLEVFDTINNRYAIARTRILPPVSISSFTAIWNADSSAAYGFVQALDNGSTTDFYRIMLHKTNLYEPDSATGGFINVATEPEFDATVDDARFFNGQNVAFGTGYNYEEGDTLIATFYHIEKSYHDYIETSRDSENANGNPFAQPPTISDNITGGRGVFTFLSFDRDTVIVEK